MYRKKLMLPAITLLFILGMSLSGCGDKETSADDSLESAIQTEQVVPEETPSADSAPADKQTSADEPEETQADDPQKQAPATAKPEQTQADAKPEQAQADAPAATEETAPSDASQSGDDTRQGMVTEVKGNSIVINELFTEEQSDGLIAVSGSDILTTVNFTDATVFIVRNVKNGGIQASDITDTPGSAADLKKDTNVIVKGTVDGSNMAATEIVINRFL